MVFPSGHEVYVLLEGVFELDYDVDPQMDCAVRIRTRNGLRISLPIEYVADWDVDAPVRARPCMCSPLLGAARYVEAHRDDLSGGVREESCAALTHPVGADIVQLADRGRGRAGN